MTDLFQHVQTEERCLLSSVSEELQDWEPHTFQSIEEEVTSLDPSQSGILHQSELTFLFLRLQMPLKLSTLACVFRSFSDARDPEQVLLRITANIVIQLVTVQFQGHLHSTK